MKTNLQNFKPCLVALMLCCGASSLFSQASPAGLTACYGFNGNANDAINSLTGTLGNVISVNDRNSNTSSAYSFTGSSSSKITLPDSPILKTPNLSIALWVAPGNVTNSQFIFFIKNKSSSDFEGLTLVVNNQKYRLVKNRPDSSNMTYAESNVNTLLNTWQHVVCTSSSDSIKVFVNGVRAGSAKAKFPIEYGAGSQFVFGSTGESFDLPFTGKVDHVKFYNRELTASEVMQVYSETTECGVSTGIASFQKQNEIAIYPNPCLNTLTILSTETSGEKTAEIYDLSGAVMRTTLLQKNESEINVSFLNSGVYFLKIKSDGVSSFTRFIKE